jgi:hypothetical protein
MYANMWSGYFIFRPQNGYKHEATRDDEEGGGVNE